MRTLRACNIQPRVATEKTDEKSVKLRYTHLRQAPPYRKEHHGNDGHTDGKTLYT